MPTPADGFAALDPTRHFPIPAFEDRHDGTHDFDFELGDWTVRNRRLRERLAGCTDWQAFDAHASVRDLPDGMGNHEILRSEHLPGYIGMAFRFYDPATRLWSIHWVDNRHRRLEPPIVGAFRDGLGVFEGVDELGGRPIRVRFLWRGGAVPRWEQAFSADAGATWETNWTMEFHRAAG